MSNSRSILDTELSILYTNPMPQKGTVLGDFVSELGEQGKKVLKETATEIVKTPLNILEGLAPVNPPEVAQKSQEYKARDQAKLAKIRSGLAMQQEMAAPPEQPKPQQGAEMAERGQTNQNAQMNNLQGQSSGIYVPPKKKMEPLAVQQKRSNKLHGAG